MSTIFIVFYERNVLNEIQGHCRLKVKVKVIQVTLLYFTYVLPLCGIQLNAVEKVNAFSSGQGLEF